MSGVGWQQFREFGAIDLTRSFVIAWAVENEALVLDIDLLLLENHPFYETPRPAEKVCIRPATIEFPWCYGLEADGLESGSTIEETSGLLKIGRIDDLQLVTDGQYALSGEFGNVAIRSERPVLRLKGH